MLMVRHDVSVAAGLGVICVVGPAVLGDDALGEAAKGWLVQPAPLDGLQFEHRERARSARRFRYCVFRYSPSSRRQWNTSIRTSGP